MITGAEIKNGKVDVQKQHVFIAFSVEDIRYELDYCNTFDKEYGGEDYIGDHDIIVSDLWIEEAILEVSDTYDYEYDSWVSMRDRIVEIIEEKTHSEYKTKVDSITGVLANDNTRGGANAS
jgi:hypothetical protein